MGSYLFERVGSMWAVQNKSDGWDLIKVKGYGSSNHGHSYTSGWQGHSDQGNMPACLAHGGGSTTALESPRFLAYRVPNRLPFLPMTPHQQDELVLLTFRQQRSARTLGSNGFFVATLAAEEVLLYSISSFKNMR
jgi:hypothetical protein